MDKDFKFLTDKINSIALNSQYEFQKELHPKNLGEAAIVKSIEIRLTIIAKYEGIAEVLKALGADTTNLEKMIEGELDAIETV